ncbi:MAG: DUF4349 domain-containing protein [Gammaproteobacteria bacterium]|nr:DUF4349 domain-containing protein [Gammaproteobacteria bacterium]
MKRGIAVAGLVLLLAGCASGTSSEMLDKSTPLRELAASGAAEPGAEQVTNDQVTNDRKIIKNASIDLEVADPEQAARSVARLADQFGGFVSNESLYRDGDGVDEITFARLQVRVPADRLTEFLDALKAEAVDVRSLNMTAQDISEQYSDIEAQLRNLRAYEDELRLLLAEVRDRPEATPDDLLSVFENIRQVRGEIEQLEGRQRLLDSQVSLATVDVTLTPSEAVAPLAREGWSAGSILRQAIRGLIVALQWIASAAIWLVAFFLPVLIVILVPIALVFWLVMWIVRRRRLPDTDGSDGT